MQSCKTESLKAFRAKQHLIQTRFCSLKEVFYRNFVYTLQSTFAGCLRPKKGDEIWGRMNTKTFTS